ncbi:tRNA 2-thiouridine(34) synthase MnmA [soil metagenome]
MSGLVVAALSGGVDSAAAAALLVEQGHRVVGMTMRLYDARGTSAASGRCCGPRDIDDARAVCDHLGIPHYVVDLSAEFGAAVMDDFVEAYLAGETPNPCVKCNQHIKFTPLLARARAIGADLLVTGHYAQITGAEHTWALRRGRDASKDQSYFLFSMPGEELGAVQFPLGHLTKDEVRAHAIRLGLPNATKDESMEICFVPDGDYAGFVKAAALKRNRPLPLACKIFDHDGTVLGAHDGTYHFTVGQHRGLGNLVTPPDPATGKASIPAKRYVTAIDPAKGEVRVGPYSAAERRQLQVRDLRWLSPPRASVTGTVQIRHRGTPIPVEATIEGSLATLALAESAVAAPGQAAVIYDGDRVLAGGWVV